MEAILYWYKDNADLINFIKDIVYFFGAYALIRYLWSWNYLRRTSQIELNLKFRERIEPALEAYVIEKNRHGIKDIGIRFVCWKNYPWCLNDDGYKHLLKTEYHNNALLDSSWIDNTGIYFQEHLWFNSSSVYVDARGIFFFAPSREYHKGFTEHSGKRLIFQLPFTKIVNFDFRQIIEYEPVFYIRHPYTKHKKLYSQKYQIREKLGDAYSCVELDSRKQISKYSLIRYWIKQLLCGLFWRQ
jgi:hypothetical protein